MICRLALIYGLPQAVSCQISGTKQGKGLPSTWLEDPELMIIINTAPLPLAL